ncbi:hypothetical protein C8R43DRAFT_830285, partial [Mycena crocata]
NSDAPAIFRCKDCFGDGLLCSTCCVDRHGCNPLHRIEVCKWNGMHFEKTSLKDLGLCVQLGHRVGERCLEPHPLHHQFVVLHTNGIHEVSVDACDCENAKLAGDWEVQMLCAGWFPAT